MIMQYRIACKRALLIPRDMLESEDEGSVRCINYYHVLPNKRKQYAMCVTNFNIQYYVDGLTSA